jgi:TorA maturation chaperone TorD
MNSKKTRSNFDLSWCSKQIELARYRAAMYRVVSSVFAVEPNEESLAHMIQKAQKAQNHECVRTYELEVISHIRGYGKEELSPLCTKIRTEYAELFLGPRPPLAPLYESLYRGFSHRLCTETTVQVRSFYERQGLMVTRYNRVPDDHIAYELEFMAYLCEKELRAFAESAVEAAYDSQKVQLDFIVTHLGKWVALFAARVSQAWCADYYKVWSSFIRRFVAEDEVDLRGKITAAPSHVSA